MKLLFRLKDAVAHFSTQIHSVLNGSINNRTAPDFYIFFILFPFLVAYLYQPVPWIMIQGARHKRRTLGYLPVSVHGLHVCT